MSEEIKGPSRGRKQCGGCKAYVGVRTKLCSCGFDFNSPEYASPTNNSAEKKKTEITTSSESSDIVPEVYKLTKEDYWVAKFGWRPNRKIYALGEAHKYERPKGSTKEEIVAWIKLMMKSLPLTGGALKNCLFHQGITKENKNVEAYVDEFVKHKEEEADTTVSEHDIDEI